MRPLLIGIAGGTASGKSSIAEIIYNNFKDTNSICIIREDDFYKDQTELPMEERVKTNYDHPLAFDRELILDFLTKLINGQEAVKPIYDFTVHNRSKQTEILKPTDVIIFEGLFVLYNANIRDLEDIKVYVDTPITLDEIMATSNPGQNTDSDLDSMLNESTDIFSKTAELLISPPWIYFIGFAVLCFLIYLIKTHLM